MITFESFNALEELKQVITGEPYRFTWLSDALNPAHRHIYAIRPIVCDNYDKPGQYFSIRQFSVLENARRYWFSYPITHWTDAEVAVFDIDPFFIFTDSLRMHSSIIRSVKLRNFNYYQSLTGSKTDKLIKTMEYSKAIIQRAAAEASRPEFKYLWDCEGQWGWDIRKDQYIVNLKREYYGEEKLDADDLATDVIGNL